MSIRPKPRYAAVSRMLNPEGRKGKLRLDKNEHVTSLPDELIQEVLKGLTAEDIAIYPAVSPLYAKLSTYLGVGQENLMLAAGSDPAIKSLYELFVGDGDRIILPKPTYAMFHVYARMFGATTIDIKYQSDLTFDREALLDSISPDIQLLAIANPNSPTGTVMEEGFLLEIVEKAKSAGVVALIDEAYHPFYHGTMIPYIHNYDNLVITRTFSKAYGLAGLRLGYVVASQSMIDLLMKVRPMYETTGIAVRFGCYVLDHMDTIENYVRQVGAGKQLLSDEMKKLGFHTHPTYANFMHVRVAVETLRNDITQGLAARNILINGQQGPPLEEYIRISLGPRKQMKAVVQGINEILGLQGGIRKENSDFILTDDS